MRNKRIQCNAKTSVKQSGKRDKDFQSFCRKICALMNEYKVYSVGATLSPWDYEKETDYLSGEERISRDYNRMKKYLKKRSGNE